MKQCFVLFEVMRVSDCGRWIYMDNGARFQRTVLAPGAVAISDDDVELLDQFNTSTGGSKKIKGQKQKKAVA